MITANEIRTRFLEFFKKNGHAEVASSALVPHDDPSLLFTNAGMVQFKKVFLGQEKRDYIRATTSQKCVRAGGKHNDLENVGRTARHHTFFEMLGNFSFGDYFKKDAIRFAWEFITEDLKLPKDKLYITIYLDDDEAHDLWLSETDIPAERIYRLGEKDNFWMMGDTGPCGPCTEIHIDQGEDMSCGPDCGIGKCDCDRYLEIWNLVFMQYEQAEDGSRTPLPKPNIDTGMGLERIAAVCQGVRSNYDTDLFLSFINFTADLANVKYKKQSEDVDTALRVIADHTRAVAFMIADGIMPSNEGRGYVLRRLIRRAYRFGRTIGLTGNFLHKSSMKVVEVMGEHYPELKENAEFMERVIIEEEERFDRTLDRGLAMLEETLETLKSQGASLVPGDVVFKLYDTYGFPIDIINDIAEKHGFEVDEAGYLDHMQEQKNRAKAAWKGGEKTLAARFQSLLEQGVSTTFVGYTELETSATITHVMNAEAEAVDSLTSGQQGWIVTDKTPFYGESGGQMGDLGTITANGVSAKVLDTQKPSPELTIHKITVTEGTLATGQFTLTVGEEERLASARNHTATHLLHAALRTVLGDHVKQQGSLVGPERLRFDFTHISAVTQEEIIAVEREINRMIIKNDTLTTETMSYVAALGRGAMALFGEKYADDVRVVAVSDESVELCGGTHLDSTGQIGSFFITSEGGVAAGVRRIEAVTGWNAFQLIQEQRAELGEIGGLLKAKSGQTVERIKGLQKEIKSLKKDIEKMAVEASCGNSNNLIDSAETINDVKVVAAQVTCPNVKALRDMMDDLRSKMDSGIICLIAENEGKVTIIVGVTKDLTGQFKAGDLVKVAATEVGGSGGGRPDMAQAGGTNPAGIDAAISALKNAIKG